MFIFAECMRFRLPCLAFLFPLPPAFALRNFPFPIDFPPLFRLLLSLRVFVFNLRSQPELSSGLLRLARPRPQLKTLTFYQKIQK